MGMMDAIVRDLAAALKSRGFRQKRRLFLLDGPEAVGGLLAHAGKGYGEFTLLGGVTFRAFAAILDASASLESPVEQGDLRLSAHAPDPATGIRSGLWWPTGPGAARLALDYIDAIMLAELREAMEPERDMKGLEDLWPRLRLDNHPNRLVGARFLLWLLKYGREEEAARVSAQLNAAGAGALVQRVRASLDSLGER